MEKLLILLFTVLTIISAHAQGPGGSNKKPEEGIPTLMPKPTKGPNGGRMLPDNGLKVEMVTPSNLKKPAVSYFLFDSLSNPLETKQYSASVRYVFGNANQYIEVNLIPSGAANQYVATLEDWKEYKQAIVIVKHSDGTKSKMTFTNDTPMADKEPINKDAHGGNNRPTRIMGNQPRY